MKLFRGLFLGLTLAAITLTPALPALNAQMPCCCSGGMQVHTYHIYTQRQQMVQQQMQMQQQMMQMQMMQQARMMQMQTQQLTMQSRLIQQRSQALTQQARTLHMSTAHLSMQSRQLTTQSRALYTTARGLHTGSRPLYTTSRSLHMTSRELNTTATRLDMHARTLNQQSRQLNTTARAIHMESRQLHTEPRQLHMQSRMLQDQARSLSTKTRWCTDVETITVVTFNMNCGQCHQNQRPMPTQVATQDLRMRNPLNLPQNPRPPVALNLPRLPQPNPFNVPQPKLPNLLPNPKRPVLMPEMWAQPRQALPGALPPRPRPGLSDSVGPLPGPIVLSEPVLPGGMWPLLREPLSNPSDRPRVATRKELKDYAVTPDRARPKTLEPVVAAQAPAPKKPALVEGITSADTSRPLPDEVLQAPSLPEAIVDHGHRRGLPGDYGLTDPPAEALPTEAILPARPLLTDADLLAPELPGLPISVLLLPDVTDPPSAIEDLDQAPALPEFTPRGPDPIARSGQGATGRPQAPRIAAENPLGAPSLPSLPPSVLGPG
jgi:hypothetical protein